MQDKPLEGLLIVADYNALVPEDWEHLTQAGAFVIRKRPGASFAVKRLATSEPLETAVDIMDEDTWGRLVALREQVKAGPAASSVQLLNIA